MFTLAQAGNQAAPGMVTMIGYAVMCLGVMYVFSIRPQKIKAKKQEEELSRLKKGDAIILISGIYGEIQSVESDVFMVKIAEKTVIKVSQQAIRGTVGSTEKSNED